MKSIMLNTATTIILISTLLAIQSQPSDKNTIVHRRNLDRAEPIHLDGGAIGPESFAFDPLGEGPYTGTSDGRIVKWLRNETRWIHFAVTSPVRKGCEGGGHDHEESEQHCGRPLGLKFNVKTGDLYICDAYMGLLMVGPKGGLATKLATQADGLTFGFTNGLDIDQQTGIVYFTDSSTVYTRRNFLSAILTSDNTGRLMKYDPKTKEVKVLLSNLSFPNGVSVSKDRTFLLVAETTKCRILKYSLDPRKGSASYQVFADLPGFTDNIKRNRKGEFWIGVHSRKTKVAHLVISRPLLGRLVASNVLFDVDKVVSVSSKWRGGGLAMRLSEEGEVLGALEDKSGIKWKSISEVEESDDGKLWIGSISMPYVGFIN